LGKATSKRQYGHFYMAPNFLKICKFYQFQKFKKAVDELMKRNCEIGRKFIFWKKYKKKNFWAFFDRDHSGVTNYYVYSNLYSNEISGIL
jgi:hypothetical protein